MPVQTIRRSSRITTPAQHCNKKFQKRLFFRPIFLYNSKDYETKGTKNMGNTVYHRRRRVRRQLLVLIGIAVVVLLLSVILLTVFLPKKPVDKPTDPTKDDPEPTPAVTVSMPLPEEK